MKQLQSTDNYDYYATLEVSPAARHEEIRASYCRLTLKWNPDKNAQESAIKLHMLNEAWEVLGVEEERKKYDKKRARQSSREANHALKSFAQSRLGAKEKTPPTITPEYSKSESEQIRQAYLDWLDRQRKRIRTCKRKLDGYEIGIRSLYSEYDRRRFIFERNLPFWCYRMAELSPEVSSEAASREYDRLRAAVSSKLDRDFDELNIIVESKRRLMRMEEEKLKLLQSELEEGESREQQRLAAERRKRRAREKRDREQWGREQQARHEEGTKQFAWWRWFNWS